MARLLVTAVFLANPAGTAAAVCTATFGTLLAAQRTLLAREDWRRQLVLANLAGLGLCLIGILLSSLPILIGTLVWACLVIAATTIAALCEPETALSNPFARLRGLIGERDTTVSFALGLVLLLAAGVSVGALLRSGGSESPPALVVASGRFRVSGTCVNGACTVNECEFTKPCGLGNKGHLPEGAPVDIVCQISGEVATAPNGKESHIWDRLPSGLYISDLFVDGTATGRFTKDLPRCSRA